MPLQPVLANGRVRLLQMEIGDEARDAWLKEQENVRRLEILKRRVYYAGEQYEKQNQETAEALGIDLLTQRMPEHRRLHAYSTQIQECIDFLADQMASDFTIECSDPAVQEIVDGSFRLSPALSGTEDEEDVDFTNVLRDALQAGDCAAQVVWDAVEAMPFYLFWESEQVRIDYDQRDMTKIEQVVVEQIVWVQDGAEERQAIERKVWKMSGVTCVVETWYDEDETPTSVEDLQIPMIPWYPLRASKKTLSATRGESLITQQAMESADRYNAVEQVAWLISRYNSHGNLAVIGDAATLKAQQDERIEKDVADVLTFPGGTALEVLSLPTDAQMIEHQRQVLLDSLYGAFGLTRIDQSTVTGLGAVSGYALEILNRKTDGTFDRIRKQVTKDLKNLLNLAIDMAAVKALLPEPDSVTGLVPDLQAQDLLASDPMAAYPDRKMEIRLGGVYIVDDVLIRDDFVAKMISQAEALRKRGYSNDEILQIQDEMKSEAPPAPEAQMFTTAQGDVVTVDANGTATLTGAAPGATDTGAAATPGTTTGATVDTTRKPTTPAPPQ